MTDKDRKRDNGFGDSDPSWGWHHEGGEISTQQETLPQKVSMGSLGTTEGSITGKKIKIKEITEIMPNHNYQPRSCSYAHICLS